MKNNSRSLLTFLGLDKTGVFGILLAIFWTSYNMVYFIRGLFSRLFGDSLEDLFIPALYVILGLLSLPFLVTKVKWKDLLLYLIIVAYFFACYRLYPNNSTFLDEVKMGFLFYALPALFVGVSLDYYKCERVLYIASFAAVFFTTLSTFLGGGITEEGGRDMVRAYSMVAPLLILFLHFIRDKRNIILLMLLIAGFLHVFTLGNRGPLACLALFILLYFLLFKDYMHQVLSRVGIGILLILFLAFLSPLMRLLSNFSGNMGMSTRIYDYYSIGELAEANGRDIIAANLLQIAVNGPFWGNGLCADRIYSDFFDTNTYAHNIALEMWVEFGIVPGSLLMLAILALFLVSLKKCSTRDEKIFLLVMFVSGIGTLLFSNSYLNSNMFFLSIGVFISYARKTSIILKK